MGTRAHIVATVAVLISLSACDSVATFDRDREVVVEGYLVANRTFGQIRLGRVQPVDETFDFESTAIRDAVVRVHRLTAGGDVVETISYSGKPGQPGVYLAESGAVVQPLTPYELDIDIPSTGEHVSSRTIVPGAYSIVDSGPDTVIYQGAQQAEVLVTRSMYPGRQAIFVFSVESLEPGFINLTPFYLDVINPDEDADEDELLDYLIVESPPFNEEGYETVSEDVLRIKVPWLAIAFYGRNLLRSNALDDNLYDFLRSQSVQQGGSTFAPGEIPNIIDHVSGGTGVFGSYSVVESDVYVERPEEPGD